MAASTSFAPGEPRGRDPEACRRGRVCVCVWGSWSDGAGLQATSPGSSTSTSRRARSPSAWPCTTARCGGGPCPQSTHLSKRTPHRATGHVQIAFEDVRLSGEEWAQCKAQAPHCQMPILVLPDGTVITQSYAILRYAGRLAGKGLPCAVAHVPVPTGWRAGCVGVRPLPGGRAGSRQGRLWTGAPGERTLSPRPLSPSRFRMWLLWLLRSRATRDGLQVDSTMYLVEDIVQNMVPSLREKARRGAQAVRFARSF